MRPQTNRTRTLSLVSFVALALLGGCESGSGAAAARAEAPFGNNVREAPSSLEASRFASSVELTPDARVARADSLAVANGWGPELSAEANLTRRAPALELQFPAQLAGALEPRTETLPLPGPVVPTSFTSSGTPTLVVGDDACETDADCVPDGCHATSCVAAAEMAPGELLCTTELRYGTTDGDGGCLCQANRCAARLSVPPQGI